MQFGKKKVFPFPLCAHSHSGCRNHSTASNWEKQRQGPDSADSVPRSAENDLLILKSGVKFVQFVRICPKSATFSPNSCSSRPTFTKLSSVLQRFQPVNSIQDFLPPYGNEGRVFSAFLKLPVFACED